MTRKVEGKNVHLFTTEKGKQLQSVIITAWLSLHDSYSEVLTTGESEQFITTVNKLITKLEDSRSQEKY